MKKFIFSFLSALMLGIFMTSVGFSKPIEKQKYDNKVSIEKSISHSLTVAEVASDHALWHYKYKHSINSFISYPNSILKTDISENGSYRHKSGSGGNSELEYIEVSYNFR